MNASAMQLAGLQDQIDTLKRTQIPPIAGRVNARIGNGIGLSIKNKAKTGWTTSDAFDEMEWDMDTLLGDYGVGTGGAPGLVISTKGTYLILASVYVTAANENSDAIMAVTKNGTNLDERGLAWAPAEVAALGSNYGGWTMVAGSVLEPGDVVSVALSPQGATTLTTPVHNSSLSVVRIA